MRDAGRRRVAACDVVFASALHNNNLGAVNADVVAVQVLQAGQDRIDLKRHRDRLGTVNADLVVAEPQLGQDRRDLSRDLQRLRDRDGTLTPDVDHRVRGREWSPPR